MMVGCAAGERAVPFQDMYQRGCTVTAWDELLEQLLGLSRLLEQFLGLPRLLE